jgi:hypothetical protein
MAHDKPSLSSSTAKTSPFDLIHLLIDHNGTYEQTLLGSHSTITNTLFSSWNYKETIV